MSFAYLSAAAPKIFAHRGLTYQNGEIKLDENCLESFQAALAAGVQYIETDLQLTKDAVAVIFHDEDLVRVAGRSGKVIDFTFAELQQMALLRGGTVISLGQALNDFPSIRFNIDIKTLAVALPAAAVINRLAAHDRVLISSFSDENRVVCLAGLSKPVASSPGLRTVLLAYLLTKLRATSLLSKLLSGFAAVQVPAKFGLVTLATRNFIQQMHAIGLEVHFWTINDLSQMERLIELGADGLVTDRSDSALQMLSN